MTIKTLLKALDTIADTVEIYSGDWNLEYTTDEYHAKELTGKVKKFRVYETDESVILMILI